MMASGACRKGDRCTGHPSCYPPRENIQGSENTFFNGIPAHRQGDKWARHKKKCGWRRKSHDGELAAGSPTVYTNGKQQGRIGDPVNCGSRVATGSSDIIIGP